MRIFDKNKNIIISGAWDVELSPCLDGKEASGGSYGEYMKIIVAGCGKIGTAILESLVAEGQDVVAIDDNADVITEITNIYDVMGVCGNSADCETLDEAGVESAQLFVAAAGSDEMNMLSCFIAKKMWAENTIARIRNPEYNDRSLGFMRQQLELSMSINPELLCAQDMFNILKLPSAVKIENFSRRNLEMIEIKLGPDSELDGMKLNKLRDKYKISFLVCAVQRGDEMYIPDGNFELKCGDKVGLTATPADIQKLLKAIGVLRRQAENVMIMGGSRTAYYLAKMLSNIGISVKIVEQDPKRCVELANSLQKAVVIQGDGAQQELLLEEGLNTVDAFVALTGIDEENMLMSIFASMHNVPKVLSKVNRTELAALAEKMGLDCIISPKNTTSNILVRYARALRNSMGSNVETLYKLMDGKAEALEFNVKADSKLLGIPLKDLNFKPNILIGGIMRGRKTIIPSGDDVIMAEDRVIVIAADQRLQDLSDIIR